MPIQLPTVQTGFEASVDTARQKIGTIKLDVAFNSKSVGDLSRPLGKLTGQADQFTRSMEAANARVLAFGASVGVLSAVTAGFNQIITTTIKVEKSLADINSVLGASATQLNKFKNDIFSVAKETGNSFQTVSDAALELSRQGLKSDEVLRRLKDSMILSRLSGLDAASAVEGLTAAVNSFSKEGVTTSDVLNKISKTAAAYAVSERDLIEGFKRSASVAQQAGVSIDELGGIITAVQQKTARGGATIGNAFKTIFTRIQRPDSLRALQDIGAAVTDAQGEILPATKLIENLAQKINGLNDIQVASITEKIGGGFQVGPLIAALDDLSSKTSSFRGATEAMATANGEAYKRNIALNQTLAASINAATVNLEELANTLGEIGVTDSLKNILSFFNSFTTNVKDLLQGEGLGSDFAKGIVKGISAVLSGPGLLLFGAIIAKLTINFVQFGATALKTFFNIGSAAKEIGAIQSTIASTLLNNKSIQTQILALEGNRVAQAQLFSTALNTQLATMEKMRSIAASIAPSIYGATTGARKAGPTAAGGYMPTVMAEANDISKGVGGARPSDKPVIIPNFAFGGGKTGTMVANTGEHIVKNYGGSGGSAIFNRNMAKGGLPSDAQQIRGAGGFIPNFVSSITDAKTKSEFESFYNQPRYKKNAEKDAITFKGTARGMAAAKAALKKETIKSEEQSSTAIIDANSLGGLGIAAISGPSNGFVNSRQTSFSNVEREVVNKAFGEGIEAIEMKNIQVRSLENLQKKARTTQSDFRDLVKQKFTSPAYELSKAILPDAFSNNEASDLAAQFQKKSDPFLFSDSVLGGIFESSIALAMKKVGDIASFNDSNQNQPFDFEEKGRATTAFKNAFEFEEPLAKGEAKKTATEGTGKTISSIIGKSLRDKDISSKIIQIGHNDSNQNQPSDFEETGRDISSKIMQIGQINKGKSASSGYIPNFVDQKYIMETLGRIKSGTSGFSKQEQETFLKKFGATGGTGKGISLQEVFDRLDSDPSVSPFINKAYSAAGATASTSQVFKEFEKQTKLNPTQLRNIVKGKGFIPNFADPLNEAISREVSAGVNPNQVYIDQNDSLKGPMNPSGLMVANRRDEPSGGWQGINRARKEGANAKTYGAANGFIPNYAPQIGQVTKLDLGRTQINDQAIVDFNNSLKAISDQLRKGAISFTEANSQVNQLATVTGNTKAQISRLQASGQNLITGYNSELQERNQKAKELRSQRSESRASTPSTEKPARDMLGTIFAIQAGLSLLVGATSDATSGLGKLANSLSSVASTATSVLFAGQGLKGLAKEGSAASAVLGKVGIYGAIAAGAFEAFKQVGSYLDSTNVSITKASGAMDKVAKAAESASISFSKFRPVDQKEIQKQREALLSGARTSGVTRMQTVSSGGLGSMTSMRAQATATFEGFTDEMEKEFNTMVDTALAAGVSYGKIWNMINENSKTGAKITAEEVEKMAKEIESLTEIAAKFKPEDVIKKFKLSPEEGLGARILGTESGDLKKLLGTDAASEISKTLTEKNIARGPAQEKALELIQDLLKSSLDTKTEESSKAIEALNIEYDKLLTSLKGQAQYTKIINELENKSLGPNNELLDIANKALLTDKDRANAIEDSNKKFETQNNLIKNQQTAYEGLRGDLEKTLSTAGLKMEDFDQIFTSISGQTNLFSAALREAFSANDFAKIEEISKQIGSNLGGFVGQQGSANAAILEYIKNLFTGEQKINDQASLLKVILGLTRDITDIDKQRNDNLAKRNELLQNSIQLDQQLKDLQIKEFTPEEFAKRKQVVELGKPKLNETSLEALQREAQKARLERDLQPVDLSRSIQEIQQSSLQTGIGQLTSIATKDADPTEVAKIIKEIAKATDLEQLRGQYNGEFNENLDKIIAKRNEEINQLKDGNYLQEQGLDLAEQRLALVEKGAFGGLESGFAKIKSENEMFAFDIGERIPQLFADNMASAMDAIIMKGEDFGDSLRSAASSFLNEITKVNIKNLASQFTAGGGTLFRANGGPITGGSGNKDDVPAMLMGGEYVMNKRAVSKYGSGFMEALNNGSVSGFADGGAVIRSRGLASDVINSSNIKNQTGEGGFQMPGYYGSGTISGKKNLLSYASQSYTSGTGDIMQGENDSAYIDLTPESVRLTTFGRNQGPMAAAVKESKQQAFDLYTQQLAAEKQAKEEAAAKKKEFRKAIMAALITSAVGTVVGAGSAGFKAGVTGAGKDAGFIKSLAAGAKGIFTGGNIGDGVMAGGLKNLFTGNFKLSQISDLKGYEQYLNKNPEEVGKFLATSASKNITKSRGETLNTFNVDNMGPDGMPTFNLPLVGEPNYDTMVLPPRITGFAAGGRIPQTSGIDTVPAMLSGGEFIMNAGATQRIGASNLNAMNSGVPTEANSSSINDQLMSKIDELIRVTKESSKPVTVNVSSQQGQTGGDREQDGGTQKDQNLSKRIKDAVVKVLQEEKRLGGVLRRS